LPTEPLPRDVVLFSTADWDHPFWTNKQHVASQLAEQGFRVLYVESLGLRRPTAKSRDLVRIASRLKRAWQPLRRVKENLWVASPLAIPWHGSAAARYLNSRWLEHWINRQCRRLGFENPIIWTYNPLVGRSVAKFGGSLLVYHCVDDLSAAPQMPVEAIRAAERELARDADLVFTTSNTLQARLAPWNVATHLLPNVADYDHFSQAREEGPIPADLASIPQPRIGFVGAVSEYKVDFELIAAVAKARPDWHWVLIGQVGEGQPGTTIDALALPNIHLLGARDYHQLPQYLRGFDVATIPARSNPYTASMFPMKFFEYLAAGLPVVATQLPALAEFFQACDLAGSEVLFTKAIDRVLSGTRPDREYCLQLARRYTWQWRTQEMLDILESVWEARQLTHQPASMPQLRAHSSSADQAARRG
jgi:glycosyltransferase involved in cell wall biosynthesis